MARTIPGLMKEAAVSLEAWLPALFHPATETVFFGREGCAQIPSPALSPELKMACLQIHELQYEGKKKLAAQHMS